VLPFFPPYRFPSLHGEPHSALIIAGYTPPLFRKGPPFFLFSLVEGRLLLDCPFPPNTLVLFFFFRVFSPERGSYPKGPRNNHSWGVFFFLYHGSFNGILGPGRAVPPPPSSVSFPPSPSETPPLPAARAPWFATSPPPFLFLPFFCEPGPQTAEGTTAAGGLFFFPHRIPHGEKSRMSFFFPESVFFFFSIRSLSSAVPSSFFLV